MNINTYFKNVFTLLKGNAGAYAISICVLPLLSRLYQPESFGFLAVFLSISGILSSFLALRLELAVFNTKTEKELIETFCSAIFVTLILTLALFVLIIPFKTYFANEFNVPEYIVLLTPLAGALLAIFNLVTNLAIVEQRFKTVASVKLMRSFVQAIAQISLYFSSKGLVIGDLISRLFVGISLALDYCKKARFYFRGISFKKVLSQHRNFLKFSVASGILNTASMQLPSIYIAFQYGPVISGIYLMTNRLVAIPLALFGQSMSQTFSSAFKLINNINEKKRLLSAVVAKSASLSFIVFLAVALITPHIVTPVLGEEWRDVATFLVYLIPMYFAQFSVFPINNVLNMLNQQKQALIWDMSRFFVLVSLSVAATFFELEVTNYLAIYSGIMFVFYLILWLVTRRNLK